jgi:hypothetical protein
VNGYGRDRNQPAIESRYSFCLRKPSSLRCRHENVSSHLMFEIYARNVQTAVNILGDLCATDNTKAGRKQTRIGEKWRSDVPEFSSSRYTTDKLKSASVK